MKKTAYMGNDWIGMFVSTNNKHTIVPIDSTKKFIETKDSDLIPEILKMHRKNLLDLLIYNKHYQEANSRWYF